MGERRYGSCTSHGFLLLLPLLLFLFLFLDVSMATTPQLNRTQESIMRNISSFVSTMWKNTSNSNPCQWRGVNCSASHSNSFMVVTNLSLSGFGLNFTIFNYICLLDTLQYLDLSRNSLTNLSDQSFTFPCSKMAGLKTLNLSSNGIAGKLGNFLGSPNLEVVDLSFNSLNGDVSAQLSSLLKLRSLNLSSNKLAGDVPTGMAVSLEELVLSGNQFIGQIPSRLFVYENLTTLDLSQNSLTGGILDEFWKFPKLRVLLLSGNNLSGAVPGNLSTITTLYRFAANENNLTGIIPSGISKHARMLDLSYNMLGGEIPSDLFLPQFLETVDLTGNRLKGRIPGNFSSSLYRLRLGSNSLDGNIPDSVGNASNLAYLELDNNNLVGDIPWQLGNCKNLTLLNLASNKLNRSVPVEFSNLKNLVVLKLQNNSLLGSVPTILSGMVNLTILNLSQNSFSGEIPPGIFQLTKLSNVNLASNNFSGAIPASISSLQSLIEVNLGHNMLTGTIPSMPTGLRTALNLSHNHLIGSIPSNIGNLKDLEILDLSYNNLSGQIPSSIQGMSSLTQLVLSYNQLSGLIPKFPSWLSSDITGNPGLTNGTEDNTTSPSDKRKRHTVLIIIFAIAGALVGLCLVAAIVRLSLLSKRIYRVEDEGPSADKGLPQIINNHLITMNSIHTSAIEFMKAMEAVADHKNIFLKTRFCTYYKALMPNGSTYSVKKLNWSDKIFQIGSQEKFGHELEVLGKLSNSNVMVPLAYVLTEDNAYLFYEHVYKGTVFDFLHGSRSDVLDWPSRYSIALGVAQGLTFLHGCSQPVLLLDLSTRTIHLKSMNEPQIGDIELYKIIDPSKSTGSLSTVAGTVGYIPPEYAYTMRLSMAGNVYSYGVILLELLTGKPPVTDGIELAKWALSFSARPDQREQILDTRVSRTSLGVCSQMLSVLNIALACVAFSPDARPKMRSVLRILFSAK